MSTSSKKRPASGSRTTSILSASSHSHSHYSAESLRTQGFDVGSSRPESSSITSPPSTLSFDNNPLQSLDYNDSFSPSFQFPSLDMSAPSPDPAAAAFHDTSHLLQQPTTGAINPIHRLDAMMFPSGDPLAYPNQPRVDFGDQRLGAHGANPGGIPHHDPTQFYMPNLYDNIEGQLLGPLPPYMMQTQAHPGFDFATTMYADPLLPMQQMGQVPPLLPPQAQVQVPTPTPLQHQSVRRIIHPQRVQQRSGTPVPRRRRPRNPEELLANTPWHGMLPQHGVD